MFALKTGALIITGPNVKGGLKMIRYALVYTFLAVFMAALVYVIGMPWTSKRRKTAWDHRREDHRPDVVESS
jgi:hypothetical protein